MYFQKGKSLSLDIFVCCYVLIFTILFFATSNHQAQASGSLSGKDIMQKVFDRNDGKNCEAKYKMILVDKHKNFRERNFVLIWAKFGDDLYTIQRFTYPKDIEGVAFLSKEVDGDSIQHIFLSALGSVRRITSAQKSNRYVQTDLTYEELERRAVEASTYKILGKEKIQVTGWGEVECYKIESTPKSTPKSQYQKIISLVHPTDFMVLKAEYYKKGKAFKEHRVLGVEKIDGFWTAKAVSVDDKERKHQTHMILIDNTLKRNQKKFHDKAFFSPYQLEHWQ